MEGRTGNFGSVKNKRGGFHLIDLIFVLFFVLIVCLVIWVLAPLSQKGEADGVREVMLEYTVQFEQVEAAFTDNIALGEAALGASDRTPLGRVSSVRNDILHSELYYHSSTDTVSMKEYPDLYDIQITLTAEAAFTPGVGYTVMGQRIAVGGSYSILFPGYLGDGMCISMREVG